MRSGQVVIDVGITKVRGILFGDVDFQQVSKVVKAITPVPGGVGPMTVVSLFEMFCYHKEAERSQIIYQINF